MKKNQKINLNWSEMKPKTRYLNFVNILRTLAPFLFRVKIINYFLKKMSLVDYSIEIGSKNIKKFFKMFSSNLYNYEILLNATCVDFLTWDCDLEREWEESENERFGLIYTISNQITGSRVLVEIRTSITAILESIMQIYKAATWLEREIFDLFGIYFLNHSDLRRLLNDYGFEGYPLRKDFPLSGKKEIKFQEERNLVQYGPVKKMQEYRKFNLENSWEFWQEEKKKIFVSKRVHTNDKL